MAAVEAIATTYLEADAANITFSSIPNTYEHLQLRCSLLGADTAAYQSVWIQLGTGGTIDTGNNYSIQGMRANGSSPGPRSAVNIDRFYVLYIAASGSPKAGYSFVETDIFNYASTTKKKSALSVLSFHGNSGGYYYSTIYGGEWNNTGAVSDVRVLAETGNLNRGSTVTLYGWNNS